MKMRDFIKDNRVELDAAIARVIGHDSNPRPNDEERQLWVLNDEGLYHWARSEGIRI